MIADGEARVSGVGLVKSYHQADRELRVLDGIDVSVGPGELVSVMGPSGSGKSTLLHLLGGLDTPDAGTVHLDGVTLSSLSDDERTRVRAERVGVIYQFFNLVPVLTASENVALPAVIAGQRPAQYSGRTAELLDLVGLGDDAAKLPSQLSGGQQQRVAIARALFNEPAVVLADEPTGNLDLDTGSEILQLFVRACAELGQSVLMVTHDPRSAACGDRVVLLRDGRLTKTLLLGPADRLAPGRTQEVVALLGTATDTDPNPDDRVEPVRGVTARWRRQAPLQADQ